jgi:hypothetical protein
MGRFFIRITDGVPFEHPIIESNFRSAFPHIDVDNLPPEFVEFEIVEPPSIGPYEKNQTFTYGWVDNGKLGYIWSCEQMTEDERIEKIQSVQDNWNANPESPSSWIFNENSCSYEPPISKPDDEESDLYFWDEDAYLANNTTGWKLPSPSI